MAKLKTDTAAAPSSESAAPQDETTTQTTTADGDNAPTPQHGEDKAPESTTKADEPPKAAAKEPQEVEFSEPDSHTLGILETFKAYESLYIDSQGSVFTLGTPERIRGGAKLYKNPHFKTQ